MFFLIFFIIFWNSVFLDVWVGDFSLVFKFLKMLCLFGRFFFVKLFFKLVLCFEEWSFDELLLLLVRNVLNFLMNLLSVKCLFLLILSLLKIKLSCLKFKFKLFVICFKFVFVMYFLFFGLYKKNSFWLGLLIDVIFFSLLLFLLFEWMFKKRLNFVVNFFKVK